MVEQAERMMRLTVVPKHSVALCPHCGGVCEEVHQTRDLNGVRDLLLAHRAVELLVRVAQFWCSPCDRGFAPPGHELAEGAYATERILARAAELIRHGDITRAARFLRVPEKTLHRWCYACVDCHRDGTPAVRIGIDELSLKKASAIRGGDRGPD